MNSVQQQGERQHWKVLIESFHLNGHTFRFDSSFHLMWLHKKKNKNNKTPHSASFP